MFFRKRDRRGDVPLQRRSPSSAVAETPDFFRIDFDMMLKGNMYRRRHGLVRQCGVTVHGSTKIVTSGDVVDRDTYDALVAVGAIRLGALGPETKTHRADLDAPRYLASPAEGRTAADTAPSQTQSGKPAEE